MHFLSFLIGLEFLLLSFCEQLEFYQVHFLLEEIYYSPEMSTLPKVTDFFLCGWQLFSCLLARLLDNLHSTLRDNFISFVICCIVWILHITKAKMFSGAQHTNLQ